MNFERLARRVAAASLLSTAAFIAFAPKPAQAACVLSGPGNSIATCTGDVSGGVSYNHTHSNGGTVSTLDVNSLTTNIAPPSGTPGLSLTWQAVNGSNGSGGDPPGSAGHPGAGSDLTLYYTQPGADIGIPSSGAIVTTNANGIIVRSQGGDGGDGGDSSGSSDGRGGTSGGDGGTVTVTINGSISSSGASLPAVLVQSLGGDGGNGGDSNSGSPGNGGAGGAGGNISLTVSGTIAAIGDESGGVVAISRGGGAGSHGGCSGVSCDNTHSGLSAVGGDVAVTVTAGTTITTDGAYANGIFAQSVGGFGASGISKTGIVVYGSNGKSGGPGGLVTVDNGGNVTTYQEGSYGIFAQSIGGGGGAGGKSGGLSSIGGAGGGGGVGGIVNVTNSGVITTFGDNSLGIFAQSVGGTGGDGGKSAGVVSIGGAGSDTSPGGAVTITNSGIVSTQGTRSYAIFAQSIGGGGGNGGSSFGVVAVGGSGGGGGAGGAVQIGNSGTLSTVGNDSSAMFAQSIGGGGGNGGGAYSLGAVFSMAIGGKGALGGDGGTVDINPTADVNSLISTTINTVGDRAHGIQAQSIGGGGGNGGLAFAGTVGAGGYSAAVALGGGGGPGGAAMAVTVNEKGTITTAGSQAYGIMAQSIGGGGGNGGGSVAVSDGGGPNYSLGLAIGGAGGSGGNAGAVTVNLVGGITTTGDLSNGLFAQSIGGGGGNGGFALSAASGAFTGSVALGGAAGVGGGADAVTVNVSDASINTSGTGAVGIFAQSVGGGGGNGGFAGAIGVGGGALSIGLGGAGAAGGVGGIVNVTNHDSISTMGDNATGILAQSVGGGGGNGGFALTGSAGAVSVAVSVGGKGGAGSNGDAATVNNFGAITTQGNLAYGILAQSIGGGGGNGGAAVSGTVAVSVKDLPAGAAAISVGGQGGGASDAGIVTLTNSGSIETHGLGAHAISAQSIGGGGGNGGLAGSLAMTLGGGAAFSVAVGGGASGGGNAAAVNVTTTAPVIITHGNGANGIFAQSVGGGGGDGGFAYSGAFGFGAETSVNVAVAIGGAGGAGGTGGTVTIDNQSAISTFGAQSSGIFAQSIGGGGGNGGMAISGTLSLTPSSVNTGVSVGGSGGSGGTANNVTVTNSGAISTAGMESIGIFAQSVGGSGGNGGLAMTSQLTGANDSSASVALAIGGGGGNGNAAGEVHVTNTSTGTIVTGGFGSHGIQAQSVGGGGGNGGMAVTAQIGVTGTAAEETKTLNVGVAVGGAGGDGGFGNTVHVINNGAINVSGDTSVGIFAQSVGGGGGNGGGAISAIGMLTDSSNTSQRSLNVNVAIGGAGGNGNHGGAVTIDNTGSIVTHGVSGYGIYAQSVGGGGGIGGRANTFSLNVTNACTICSDGPEFKNFFSLGAAVGGNGGGASNGGVVTVTNTGRIETFGDASDGIYAQSVGGGGGNGGNGTLGLAGVLPYGELASQIGSANGAVSKYQNVQVSVGGNNGSSGDGGVVHVDNNKDIITHGAHSNAITAQSVGGGGGFGGNAADGDSGVLNIGGKGGAGGNGGAVTVTQHGGATIETLGNASYGIFAQSVGGGGGVSGNSGNLLATVGMNFGVAPIIGQGGGSGGNGGQVDVSVDGTILTHGNNAHAIFAQSVGGGGGALGDFGSGSNVASWQLGSTGDAGNGGPVNVTLAGAIMTSGNNAAGVFAQSAAGNGHAGNVSVTINGSVVTGAILASGDGTAGAPLRGLGSIGILAQSVAVGNANNGDITINLNNSNGVVQGGRTQNSNLGVGIWLVDGKNNAITNQGLVTTVSGVDGGYAILATGSDVVLQPGGNETVNNFGTVIGSVDLGAGTNVFNNKAGALFSPGAIAYIGAGNTLTNDGTISPGALGKTMTTAVTGDFVQSSTGKYALDVNLTATTADRFNVSGTANITGTVAINVPGPTAPVTGQHQVTILSAAGAVTNHAGLALTYFPSIIMTYALVYPNANDVNLAYSVNYAPAGLPARLTSIANAANQIQASGNFPGFAPLANALFGATSVNALAGIYNQLGGEGSVATQQTAINTGSAFLSSLMDQAEAWLHGDDLAAGGSSASFADEGSEALGFAARFKPASSPGRDAFAAVGVIPPANRWRVWMAGFGGKQSVDGNMGSGTASVSRSAYGGIIGVDRQVNSNLLIGVSLGSSNSNFSVPNRTTSGTAEGIHLGAYATVRNGASYLAATMGYANYDNKTKRGIGGVVPPEFVSAQFRSDQFSTRFEMGRKQTFGVFDMTPFVALEYSGLWQRSYSEVGTFGLTYPGQRTDSLPSFVGAQFDKRWVSSNGSVISAFSRVSWVHEFIPDREATASFNVAPGVPFSTIGARAVSDLLRVNAGGRIASGNIGLFANAIGEWGNGTRSYGVSGGAQLKW